MVSTTLKFGGRIIEELSQKIPSSLFALNELIKNSYDAFSPDVVITIVPSKLMVKISDTGNGMSEEEIHSLFHISKSTKKYGNEICQNGITRIIQGSKGLGFLSAFKFGDEVEWKTCKNGIRSTFSVQKADLINKDDVLSTKKIKPYVSECENSQLFYVIYNSAKGQINFFHKGELIDQTPFSIDRTDYSIDIDLVIFLFGKGKSARTISNLHKRLHDNALYPLIYVNKNLFNNTNLFDPDLLRKRSSGSSLPQMIGRVLILSQNKKMEFNSDRTFFVENNITKSIVSNLQKLNETIQIRGSELKNQLKSNPSSSLTGKAFPNDENKVIKNKPASILIDRKKNIKFSIPSEQIDLSEYIYSVKDSNGNDVNKNNVKISIDNFEINNNILGALEEPSEMEVVFRYEDSVTGLVSASIYLFFEKKLSNISGNKEDKSLFTIQSASDYTIKIGTVSSIIYAIDKLYSLREKDGYLPLIACSIRSIFEISQDKLIRTHRFLFPQLKIQSYIPEAKREMKDKLLGNIIHIILLIKKNPKLSTKIAEKLDISYSTFSNSLNVDEFKTAVKYSHIGAHQSTKFLSKPKIEVCADSCGLFAVICDVLINMDKKDINDLNIVRIDAHDINQCFVG